MQVKNIKPLFQRLEQKIPHALLSQYMGKLLTHNSIACRLGQEADSYFQKILILQRNDRDVFDVLPMVKSMRDAKEWEWRGYLEGSILYLTG